MPPLEPTRHQVFFHSAERMAQLADESIHLVVTSPPYPMIAMWDELFSRNDAAVARALRGADGNAAFSLMHRNLDRVWAEVGRVLAPGGFACINIGDATRTVDAHFALYPNHMRIQQALTALGLTVLPGIIWRKQTNAPNKFMGSGVLPAGAYVTLEHEYILIFRKGQKRAFTTDVQKARRRASALFWEERNAWFSDVWFDVKGARQSLGDPDARQRSAAFPVDIACRLIAMYSVKGDRVLDPFLGTATTTAAAMAGGRHSVGYEIDPDLAAAVDQTAGQSAALSRAQHHRRLQGHLDFLESRRREHRLPMHRNEHYRFPVVMAQETSLIFNDAVRVDRVGAGEWRVDYEGSPQAAFCRDWQAWAAAAEPCGDDAGLPQGEGPDPRQRSLF